MNFECKYGFKYLSGNYSVTCIFIQDNGTGFHAANWSSATLNCGAKRCIHPLNYTSELWPGNLLLANGSEVYSLNDTVTVICNPTHWVPRQVQWTCSQDESWQRPSLNCYDKFCPYLPYSPNATLKNITMDEIKIISNSYMPNSHFYAYTENTTLTYECNAGYVNIAGIDSVECKSESETRDATWSPRVGNSPIFYRDPFDICRCMLSHAFTTF